MPIPKLLAIDIDGTLLDSKHAFPERNLAALQRAHDTGIEIVLVTGRRHAFALPIAEQIGRDVCVISSNGAVTRSLAGEIFYCDLLPVETARAMCTHMDEFRGNLVFTFTGDGPGTMAMEHDQEIGKSVRGWIEKNRTAISFVQPIEDALTRDPIQGMFCGTLERMRGAEERLRNWSGIGGITLLKTHYPQRDLSILDFLNCGCSKGHALERWAKRRGISAPEVVAIGDNYNDIEMLNFAGQAFIMENACADLKQNGWMRVPSNDECGVAYAIEQILG
jgi:Cof subfamily protein (haloacid dehalogenase superfamily)